MLGFVMSATTGAGPAKLVTANATNSAKQAKVLKNDLFIVTSSGYQLMDLVKVQKIAI